VWGEPRDRAECIRTLKRAPELGVNFIDTADSYGPETSENLIREALHPYDGLLIATKGGLTRPGPDRWVPNGRRDYLIERAHKSRAHLGVKRIDLWQLHAIDRSVPREEQLGAVKTLIDEGVIRFAGLSNVTVDDIEAASKLFKVATVQNRYNLADRASEAVLAHCENHGIGFNPVVSAGGRRSRQARLGARRHRQAPPRRAKPDRARLAVEAQPRDAADSGHGKVAHLEENVCAVDITLSDDDFAALDRAGRK